MDSLLISIKGKVISVADNITLRNEEGLLCAFAIHLYTFSVVKAGDYIRDVVLYNFIAFLVERETVSFHVVKPNLVGASGIGLGKDKDGSRYVGIWKEYSRRHRDDSFETLIFNQLLTQVFVRLGCTGKNTIGHNRGTSTSDFQ